MTIRDDALYKLYLVLSLDDVDAKRRRAFFTIVHALRGKKIERAIIR
jgi:hypothetical protein